MDLTFFLFEFLHDEISLIFSLLCKQFNIARIIFSCIIVRWQLFFEFFGDDVLADLMISEQTSIFSESNLLNGFDSFIFCNYLYM